MSGVFQLIHLNVRQHHARGGVMFGHSLNAACKRNSPETVRSPSPAVSEGPE